MSSSPRASADTPEYVAVALRPYAEHRDLVNFRHERTPSTLPFLIPETDLICYSINWRKDRELIRDDINELPPGGEQDLPFVNRS